MLQVLRTDQVLLSTLLALWLVAFGLQLRAIVLTGQAMPPLFAEPAASSDSYPHVGGVWPESGQLAPELRVGDRLIRVGGSDLRGVGYIGFTARAVGEAGLALETPLVFEREGERREIILRLGSPPIPWQRIPVEIACVMSALLVLIGSRGSPMGRTYFTGVMALAIFVTQFHGVSYAQTFAARSVHNFGGIVGLALILRWVILFPEERSAGRRLDPRWAWAISLPFLLLRANYMLGGPLPVHLVSIATLAWDAVWVTTLLAILSWNYQQATPIGRRRVKWILVGAWIGLLPTALNSAVGAVWPEFPDFQLGQALAIVAAGVVPLFILLAVVRFNAFDVDRLVTAMASYTLLFAVGLGALLTLVPWLAEGLAGLGVGLGVGLGENILSLALAFALIPVDRSLRPRVDRLLNARRHARVEQVATLLHELNGGKPDQLLGEAADGVREIFDAESCVAYGTTSDELAPIFVRGKAIPPAINLDSGLATALEVAARPLVVQAGAGLDRGLDAEDASLLDSLGVSAIVPIHDDNGLSAVIALGPQQSGDVYTATDLALLQTVAEKLGDELRRFDTEEILRRGEGVRDALRRYVPMAIADSLERGEAPEASERHVTVLFVDLRGYTSFSKSREAGEVFSMVNRYTESVSRVISDHRGSVVEFSGDGLMAVFGAPTTLERKEQAAVDAALEIIASTGSSEPTAFTPLAAGVGVATGPAFIGSIRSAERWIWTAIGATTNLAARLQDLSKGLDATIVIDAPTWAGAGTSRNAFERRNQVAVRGLDETLDLYVVPRPRPRSPHQR